MVDYLRQEFNLKNRLTFSNNVPSDVETSSYKGDQELKKLDEFEAYNEEFPEPTDEDYATLPRVPGHPPYFAYLICLVEFAERASYYGVSGRLSDFIQLPLPEGGNGAGAPPARTQLNAGALGLGLRAASGVTLLLQFLSYLTPLWGGYISDKRFGRVRTIWYGVWIGFTAHIVLIIAGIPSVIASGHALAPTIISILLLALTTGFIKPNLLPLLLDQYPHKRDIVQTKADGKRVIISRETTLERMTLVFYWSINIGAFLSLGTSYCAKRIGFWLAFLVPGIAYIIMVPVLLILGPKMKKEKPNGESIVEESLKVLRYALSKGWYSRARKGEFFSYAKPSKILERGDVSEIDAVSKKGTKKISWTDQFVDDVRVTIDACKIFSFFIIYIIADGGIGSIENSQSNSLTTNGVPNDLINNFNPLTIIVFIPIQDYIIYPVLRKFKIDFRPAYRIFTGFILAALSQLAGAIIQWKIYKTSPCGYYATECDIGTGVSPISVWVEVVLYILGALSECFANVSVYEVAYTRAPEHMKGLVLAIFLFMYSISAAISEACTSALVDPYLIWPFAAVAIGGFVSAIVFLWLYKDLHIVMEKETIEKEQKLKREIALKYGITGIDNEVNDVVSQKAKENQAYNEVLATEDALEFKER